MPAWLSTAVTARPPAGQDIADLVEALTPVPPIPPAATLPWTRVVDAWLDSRVESPATRRVYGRHLRAFFAFVEVPAFGMLSGELLAHYRGHVLAQAHLAPGSRASAIHAVRACLKWTRAIGAHQLGRDIVDEVLRVPKATVIRPYSALDAPELAAVLAAAQARGPADLALAMVALGSGLRVGELSHLDVADIVGDGAGGVALHVRQGKGAKDRVVPVRAEVGDAMLAMLAADGRTLQSSGPLFLRRDRAHPRGRLTPAGISCRLRGWLSAAGVTKRISPHSLRHTYAIRNLRAGASPVAVMQLLGHSSLTHTQRYLDHLALDELRAAIAPLSLGSANHQRPGVRP